MIMVIIGRGPKKGGCEVGCPPFVGAVWVCIQAGMLHEQQMNEQLSAQRRAEALRAPSRLRLLLH